MLSELWNAIKRIFGLEATWEIATLSRVAVDPMSSRLLTQVLQPVHTIRLRPERDEEDLPPASRVELSWHGITDKGMVRQNNEDSLALLSIGDDALFVVADGMGGHEAGEVASSRAVATVTREIRRGRQRGEDPMKVVERAVKEANKAVRQEAVSRGSNMGTTLAVALVAGSTAYIANVGDSRVYWLENGSITQVTRDHSLVAKLVAAGKLTKEEARTDPRSNLLYRTVGSDEEIAVDAFRLPLATGGLLLLCSDGLWGEVSDEELHRTCSGEERTEVLCARLVQLANANGGKDNITAIAMKVS